MAAMLTQLIAGAKSALGMAPKSKSRADMDADFPDRPSDPAIDLPTAEAWVTTKFQKLRTAYLTYHRNVWESILFYVGQTWIRWDGNRYAFYPQEAVNEDQPMPRVNYFAPAIDAICTNFNTIPPIECAAREADGDEQYRRHGIAEVANRLAKDLLMRTGLKSDFQSKGDTPSEAAQWFVLSATFGTYVQCRAAKPVQSEHLGTIQQQSVEVDLCSSLAMLPRPGSRSISGIDGSPFLLIARRMPIDEIYNRFQVNAFPDREYLDGYNSMYESALNYFYTGFNAGDVASEDSALCLEVFIPPDSPHHSGVREFSDTGLYGVYANQKLKYAEPWKFPDHPITKFDYFRVPTLFFGRTPAFDMVNLQREVQKYDSIIQLHAMTNACTPWVVDENTLTSDITGSGDVVIKYRSLGPNSPAPHRVAAGVMDAGVYAHRQVLVSQFESISGAASVFRGRQEGSVVAASAIAQLRGQAEQMFSRPVLNWNNGWKETTRKGVIFMQKCYTLPQIQAIVGNGFDSAISDFIACDLDTCIEWLAADHGLPRTQDELRQEMLELADKRLLDMNDPNVKERAFRLFGETGMLQQFSLDATRARMENKFMKSGTPPVFRPAIEDLQTHYTIHVEMVKSMEFDRLPPNIQEVYLAHVMETKAAMMPPPPPPEPDSLTITGNLADMPPALTDAVLEKHGIHPAPAILPPPPHHVGKPLPPGELPPPVDSHPGTQTRGGEAPRTAHDPGSLASEGKPTGSPLLHGQGIHAVGTSQGAPPSPTAKPSLLRP